MIINVHNIHKDPEVDRILDFHGLSKIFRVLFPYSMYSRMIIDVSLPVFLCSQIAIGPGIARQMELEGSLTNRQDFKVPMGAPLRVPQ